MNILQVKKYYIPLNKVIKQAWFADSTLGKALEKRTRENKCKKQIKLIEDHGKQLIKSKELIKKDFNIGRDSIPLEEQKNTYWPC